MTSLAEALADRDALRLSRLLGDDVRLRGILPAGLVELSGREAVLAEFHRWFEGFDSVGLAAEVSDLLCDRVLLHFRLELAKGDRSWLMAQSAVCTVTEGRLAAMDVVCTGFRPLD